MAHTDSASSGRSDARNRRALLRLDGVDAGYGLSRILFQVDVSVFEGEVVALLGRNGAGKTTTLKTIVGLAQLKAGSITIDGEEISGRRPCEIARRGLGYVPQDRRIFGDLTVRENLEVGRRKGEWGKKEFSLEIIHELFPTLQEMSNRRGGLLSGGEQQMLSIARTLMGNPRLLLLDEPSEGLAPFIVRRLTDLVLQLKESGITILLSEQNTHFVRKVCDRAYILDTGRVRKCGSLDSVLDNQDMVKKYLMI